MIHIGTLILVPIILTFMYSDLHRRYPVLELDGDRSCNLKDHYQRVEAPLPISDNVVIIKNKLYAVKVKDRLDKLERRNRPTRNQLITMQQQRAREREIEMFHEHQKRMQVRDQYFDQLKPIWTMKTEMNAVERCSVKVPDIADIDFDYHL